MSNYIGPERRRTLNDDDALMMLARIDERVKNIDKKLDSHIADHEKRGGVAIQWISIASAVALSVWANLKR